MEDDAEPHYTFANSKQSERHLEYSRSLAKLLHFRIYKIVSLSAAASRKRLNTFFCCEKDDYVFVLFALVILFSR